VVVIDGTEEQIDVALRVVHAGLESLGNLVE